MDQMHFFRGERVTGPFPLDINNGRAQLTCSVTEEWISKKAWSISCGEKHRYVLKKRLGVSATERQELEATITGSLKLIGISELKSQIKSKLGLEFRIEESVEEEDEFTFEAPKCGRLDHRVYQLKRVYRFSSRDKRSWIERLPHPWRKNDFTQTIEEWVDDIYGAPIPTDPDPACGCKDSRSEIDGLVTLFLGKISTVVGYKRTEQGLNIPSLNFSANVSGIGELLHSDFVFERNVIPPYLLFLADERATRLKGRFLPYVAVLRREAKQTQRAEASDSLLYLLVGGGLGAIAGLLFAPRSGQQLRTDIGLRMRKGSRRSREFARPLPNRPADYYDRAPNRERHSAVSEAITGVGHTDREFTVEGTDTVGVAAKRSMTTSKKETAERDPVQSA
jgi:gas vesicle protein